VGFPAEYFRQHLFLSKTEAVRCICPKCKVERVVLYHPREPDNYPYLQKKWWCNTCIRLAETLFLQALKKAPLEELPLWIGHEWVTAWNEEDFQGIITARLGPEALSPHTP